MRANSLSGDQKPARGDVVMVSSMVNVPAGIHHAADVLSSRMAGDTIEGTFESLSSDSNVPQRGRWKVKRVSGATP